MKNKADVPFFDSKDFYSKFTNRSESMINRQEPFKVFRIEDVIASIKFPLPLHRTNYYDIMFVTKGRDALKHCGLRQYKVSGSQIFFKAARQISSGDVMNRDITGYYCVVEEDFMANYAGMKSPLYTLPFFKYGNNPVVSLSASEVSRLEFVFENMHKLYHTDDKGTDKNQLTASYLNVLLQECAVIHQKQNAANNGNIASTAEELTDKFKDLVAEHYLTRRMVNEYADMLFITPNHLNKVIKKTTGKTASDLVFEMLLMESQILLKQTAMTVAEIAFYLSFEDASYFTRFFKKQTGLTPLKYRSQS